jgi:hypothetical protein
MFYEVHFNTNTEEHLDIPDTKGYYKLIRIDSNKIMIQIFKRYRFRDMKELNENDSSFYLLKESVIREDQEMDVGNYLISTIWEMIGGMENKFRSASDEQ